MHIQKAILLILVFYLSISCNEETCEGLNSIVKEYIPSEELTSAKYISTEGTFLTFTFENFISGQYTYYEWCKTCECGEGAQIIGNANTGGNTFAIEYTIKDEILQQTRKDIWETIKQNDYYEYNIYMRSPWDPWSNEPEIYPGFSISLKVNFKEKKYLDLEKYSTNYKNFIAEMDIEGTIYNNVIEYEFDTLSHETIMRKVYIAEEVGIVKIEMAEKRNWLLQNTN